MRLEGKRNRVIDISLCLIFASPKGQHNSLSAMITCIIKEGSSFVRQEQMNPLSSSLNFMQLTVTMFKLRLVWDVRMSTMCLACNVIG
ncbi:hypothetical protein L1987_11425 [Smallanthus sonchifolius]|uniref:Uncharacterized protein n=1 Tax=Smallanthus sonchifolius TaxID=185202 RepID=A0ACB9JAX5_9ASTR|nr:hypothetical protein L1987_11425 [Smallanthus sonchifolius]